MSAFISVGIEYVMLFEGRGSTRFGLGSDS